MLYLQWNVVQNIRKVHAAVSNTLHGLSHQWAGNSGDLVSVAYSRAELALYSCSLGLQIVLFESCFSLLGVPGRCGSMTGTYNSALTPLAHAPPFEAIFTIFRAHSDIIQVHVSLLEHLQSSGVDTG